MADASTTVKLSPPEFDLVIEALHEKWEMHKEEVSDHPGAEDVIKTDGAKMIQVEGLLRTLGYPVER